MTKKKHEKGHFTKIAMGILGILLCNLIVIFDV